MGSFGVAKGKRAERSVASALNAVLEKISLESGHQLRILRRNLVQSQQGGHDLVGVDWISIEIKHHNEISGKLNSWWQQTLRQAGPVMGPNGVVTYTREPVLIYKTNGTRWRVMLFTGIRIKPGKRLKVPAIIEWEDFLVWFKMRCEAEHAPEAVEGLFGPSSL